METVQETLDRCFRQRYEGIKGNYLVNIEIIPISGTELIYIHVADKDTKDEIAQLYNEFTSENKETNHKRAKLYLDWLQFYEPDPYTLLIKADKLKQFQASAGIVHTHTQEELNDIMGNK